MNISCFQQKYTKNRNKLKFQFLLLETMCSTPTSSKDTLERAAVLLEFPAPISCS